MKPWVVWTVVLASVAFVAALVLWWFLKLRPRNLEQQKQADEKLEVWRRETSYYANQISKLQGQERVDQIAVARSFKTGMQNLLDVQKPRMTTKQRSYWQGEVNRISQDIDDYERERVGVN